LKIVNFFENSKLNVFFLNFLEGINEITQNHEKEAKVKKEEKRRRDDQKGGKCLLKEGKWSP
jgi:hypothetical protein